jgi:6-pyruvoyltetrahydropterin/6-carboxytetrahydropterin synthase
VSAERRPWVRVTRGVEFSAAHRLHSPFLSDAANRALYGKCNNPNGHGHTYRLEATVRGPVDAATGLVTVTARLEAALAELVVARFDGASLDRDIAELAGTSRTSEQLALVLRDLLAGAVGPALVRVVLHETPNNVFEPVPAGPAAAGADPGAPASASTRTSDEARRQR